MISELITRIHPAAQDSRRVIFEISLEEVEKYGGFKPLRFQDFTITNANPLGNHFHRELHELFLITQGEEVQVHLENIETHEFIPTLVSAGSLIRIPPGIAHAFRFQNGIGTMVCFSSTEEHDPVDMPKCEIMAPNGNSLSPVSFLNPDRW